MVFSVWMASASPPSPVPRMMATSGAAAAPIAFTASSMRALRDMASVALRLEPALGVDGGHAAHAGGGDRLTIDVVHAVARGEHALHAGVGPLRHFDVARLIQGDVALEER